MQGPYFILKNVGMYLFIYLLEQLKAQQDQFVSFFKIKRISLMLWDCAIH